MNVYSPMKKLGLPFIPLNNNLALLLLRLSFGITMIAVHGWGKLIHWEQKIHHFPDFVFTSELSFALVVWFENIGAVSLILGLLTRLHAAGLVITMAVAFIFQHHAQLTGEHSGEMAYLYGFGFLLLFLSGPGKYSFDHKLGIA